MRVWFKIYSQHLGTISKIFYTHSEEGKNTKRHNIYADKCHSIQHNTSFLSMNIQSKKKKKKVCNIQKESMHTCIRGRLDMYKLILQYIELESCSNLI